EPGCKQLATGWGNAPAHETQRDSSEDEARKHQRKRCYRQQADDEACKHRSRQASGKRQRRAAIVKVAELAGRGERRHDAAEHDHRAGNELWLSQCHDRRCKERTADAAYPLETGAGDDGERAEQEIAAEGHFTVSIRPLLLVLKRWKRQLQPRGSRGEWRV